MDTHNTVSHRNTPAPPHRCSRTSQNACFTPVELGIDMARGCPAPAYLPTPFHGWRYQQSHGTPGICRVEGRYPDLGPGISSRWSSSRLGSRLGWEWRTDWASPLPVQTPQVDTTQCVYTSCNTCVSPNMWEHPDLWRNVVAMALVPQANAPRKPC